MDESVALILSQVFYFLTFSTPIISFIIVRKKRTRLVFKILYGIVLTLLLGVLFIITGLVFLVHSGVVS